MHVKKSSNLKSQLNYIPISYYNLIMKKLLFKFYGIVMYDLMK